MAEMHTEQEIRRVYRQKRAMILGDLYADPFVQEQRDTLRNLIQLRNDWWRRVVLAPTATATAVRREAERQIERLPIIGAPVFLKPDGTALTLNSDGEAVWNWARNTTDTFRFRVDNPTGTTSGQDGLGYVHPDFYRHLYDNEWETSCAPPTQNPTYGSLVFSIHASTSGLRSLTRQRPDDYPNVLEFGIRNYAGTSVFKLRVNNIGPA